MQTNEQPIQRSIGPICSTIDKERRCWGWQLALAIILIILGILSLIFASATTLFNAYFLGIVLLISGAALFIYSWFTEWGSFFITLLLGILFIITASLYLGQAENSTDAVSLIMGSFFLVGGFFKFFGSIAARFEQWVWVCISGIVSVILGILTVSDTPTVDLSLVGIYLGVVLLFYGSAWLIRSIVAKHRHKSLIDEEKSL